MKQTIKCLFAAFAVMLVSVVSFAQVTTSSLGGRIVDAKGEPVVGAAVVAVHTPSGTTYGAVTNENGRYAIHGMRPGGPYNVEISCLGYQATTYTDVTLQLAEAFALNAAMNEDAQMLSEVIVIAAPVSKFSAEKMGSATNISSKQIESIPTVSRSLDDITRLSPYGGTGMSFAGTDGRSSNFTVDGANFNNNFGLNDGLPAGNPISIDAIEEMQVVISPYDVRQTNFVGGGVNAITKSGSNTFRGSAYVYHRNENMRGDMVAGQNVANAREKDSNTTYGMTLGGPIIKDKLFFFVNAEYVMKPTVANSWKASDDGVANADQFISRVTYKDLEDVSKFVKEKYGYDTGSWTDFPANETNFKVLARIDWNINEKHKLAARYNYTSNLYYRTPSGTSVDGGTKAPDGFERCSQYGLTYANSMYGQNNYVHSASLDLNSRLTDNLSNQLLFTFSKQDDVRTTPSDDMPFIDIRKDDGSSVAPYICLGYELFSWKNAVHNTHVGLKDDVTYYAGDHKITAGLGYEYQMTDNMYIRNGSGYYRYRSLEDFYAQETPEIVCLTYGYDGEEAPAVRVRFHKLGAYAQDEWNATENFKLTYGLRLEGLFFDNQDLLRNQAVYDLEYVVDGEKRHIDTGKWPSSSVNILPRVGFSWDIFGNNSLKLRGGTGLFSGRLPLVFFTNMPTNSGMTQCVVKLNSDGNKGDMVDMSQFKGPILKRQDLIKKIQSMGYPTTIKPEDGTIPSEFAAVAPDFKMPQIWKTSLALDYNIPVSFPFTIGVEGIFNKTINGVLMRDWSVKNVEGFARFNGVDNRPIYQEYKQTYVTSDGKVKNLPNSYVMENTNRGYGYSGTFTLNMRPLPELAINASYTHIASKELSGMPGSNAGSVMNAMYGIYGPNNPTLSNSRFVTPDRAIVSLTYSDKGHNHYTLIYEGWRGGYNYTYTTSNDMNGDGYNADLIYIPTDKQVADNEFRFVSEDDATRFMDFVHADKYLSKNQGKYSEGYSVYSPWVHRLDFSYKHDFKIKAGNSMNTIQLCLDLKNILNFVDSSLGVSKIMNTSLNKGQILKYEGIDKEGYPTFSTPSAVNGNTQLWQPSFTAGQCWYASIGIKYMFN